MKLSHFLKKSGYALIFAVMLLGALLFIGCSGDDGATGATGAIGPTGATGPTGPTASAGAETCYLCHTGAIPSADVALKHPDRNEFAEDVTITINSITNPAGVLTVAFHAEGSKSGAVTDLVTRFNDLNDTGTIRFYIADMVPADTDTLGGWGTWDEAQFERWAYERTGNDRDGNPYPHGALATGAASGDYIYTFETGLDSTEALAEAPDYSDTHTQRLVITVEGTVDASAIPLTNNASAIQDFTITAAADATAEFLTPQRQIVTTEACKACHGPLFDRAAHADTYLDTRACVICHSPIGHYGDLMQEDSAYFGPLGHQIHAAIANPAFPDRPIIDGASNISGSWELVGFPRNQSGAYEGAQDCVTCHTGDGDQVDNWKTEPTAQYCGSCHTNVNFETGENHAGGPQANNNLCAACHPSSGPITNFLFPVPAVHDTTLTGNNVPEFDVAITMTPPVNGSFYVPGTDEAPVVTVTLTDHATGQPVDPAVYTTPAEEAGNPGGGLSEANLYVYGPRAKSVPVLALETITDPNFNPLTGAPTQGHSLFVNDDGTLPPNVTTDATGFRYQLLAIPAGMESGTYMVRFEGADYGGVSATDYVTSSTNLINFQVGNNEIEPKVAGDESCTYCHGETRMHLTGAHAHNVPFDTDYCLACHDQSNNYAIPLADRVHAVHYANSSGDIFNIEGTGSRDWSEISFPRDIAPPDNSGCVTCHPVDTSSGTYLTNPFMMPCVGCHSTDDAIAHMQQNGGPYPRP